MGSAASTAAGGGGGGGRDGGDDDGDMWLADAAGRFCDIRKRRAKASSPLASLGTSADGTSAGTESSALTSC